MLAPLLFSLAPYFCPWPRGGSPSFFILESPLRLGLETCLGELFFGVSVSKVSGLGLQGFRSRSRALRPETLHRPFFVKFCKEFLKQTVSKMIVQNLVVQRDQWLSFLCCLWDGENDLPSARLKFMLNSIKKCACTYETAERNLCNERLGVAYFAKDYLWTVFPIMLLLNP